jgi:hypothetical protein
MTGVVTQDPNVRMQWKLYWRNVVKRYKVVIDGWPADIPFKNLSDMTNSTADLEGLLRKWMTGATHWRNLSEEEFRQMEKDWDEEIEAGNIDEPSRRRRSDHGKKRSRNDKSQRASKKARSQSTILSSDEEGMGLD